MRKRTPLTLNETGYAYVFLSAPGVVLKVHATVEHYYWLGNRLTIDMQKATVSIASYSGKRDMVYFPKVNQTRPLRKFIYDFQNGNMPSRRCYLEIDGVESLNKPNIPDDFDSNVSTLSVLRYMRIPPPDSVSLYWHSVGDKPIYKCGINCVEGGRKSHSSKQNKIDELLESIL